MPNPVRPLPKAWEKKRSRKLTPKQKSLVKNFRKRYGNRQIYYYTIGDRLSVHLPLADNKRRAKKAGMKKVKRYPHAYDTRQQTQLGARTIKKIQNNKRVKGKGILDRLFP